jgi:hypothetical protein
VLLRIQQITRGALLVEQGPLYPALARLEHHPSSKNDPMISPPPISQTFFPG